MRRPRPLALVGVLLVAGAVGVFGGQWLGSLTQPFANTIEVQADGLATFTWRRSDGPCPAFGLADAVAGVLVADPSAQPPVWLDAAQGHSAFVVWPAGFHLSFEPAAVIRNELGAVIARQGETVTLDQTHPTEASGTAQDPYIAHGLVFGGCYPYPTR